MQKTHLNLNNFVTFTLYITSTITNSWIEKNIIKIYANYTQKGQHSNVATLVSTSYQHLLRSCHVQTPTSSISAGAVSAASSNPSDDDSTSSANSTPISSSNGWLQTFKIWTFVCFSLGVVGLEPGLLLCVIFKWLKLASTSSVIYRSTLDWTALADALLIFSCFCGQCVWPPRPSAVRVWLKETDEPTEALPGLLVLESEEVGAELCRDERSERNPMCDSILGRL